MVVLIIISRHFTVSQIFIGMTYHVSSLYHFLCHDLAGLRNFSLGPVYLYGL